ncbi:MAG: hypothetical protein ABJK64_17820 [Paraglaciecola sp.]|uniref:hypothetical protein n=1 Tax=Paraglaciecola sp. TaxID=1920173 RepID=UPI003297C73F
MNKKLLSLLFFCFMPIAKADTLSISKPNVTESFSTTVKVSGNFYLGMVYNTNEKVEQLSVLLPDDSTGMLCISISSIDGKYKANLSHQLVKPVSGLTQLSFKSEYEDELKTYRSNQLAVLSTISKSCDDTNRRNIISSWNPDIANKNVLLLIRSDARMDVVHFPNSETKIKCKKFRDEIKVTYDKYCELAGVDITKIGQLSIHRKNFRDMPVQSIQMAY